MSAVAAIAQVGDEAGLAAIRDLFREYGETFARTARFCFKGFEEETAALPGAYVPPAGRLLLARQGGEAAGCVALRRLDDEACELKRLWVRPAHRGHGLGRRLVDAALSEARASGYRVIRLDTLPEAMPEAVALYRALGFREILPYLPSPNPGATCFELRL